jgi:hypothetical protein
MRHIGSAPKGMTDRLHEVVAGQRQYKAAYGNEGLKRKKALREQGLENCAASLINSRSKGDSACAMDDRY